MIDEFKRSFRFIWRIGLNLRAISLWRCEHTDGAGTKLLWADDRPRARARERARELRAVFGARNSSKVTMLRRQRPALTVDGDQSATRVFPGYASQQNANAN